MIQEELDRLEGLWRLWAELGESMSEEDWALPTVNEKWSVKETYAHHSQAVGRLEEFQQAQTALPAEHHRAADFFLQFTQRSDDAALVAEAAAREAESTSIDELIDAFKRRGPAAIESARMVQDDVVQTDEGRIRFSEWLKTRVVEAVVHLIDLQEALGKTPDVDEAALRETAYVLIDFTDPVRFIKMATGRSEEKLFPVFW